MQGCGKKAEERIELVLGIPGDNGIGPNPAARGDQPDCDDHAEAGEKLTQRHCRRRGRARGRRRRAVGAFNIRRDLGHRTLLIRTARTICNRHSLSEHGVRAGKCRAASEAFVLRRNVPG